MRTVTISNEIPDFEEFGIIFKKFAGGKIFFWHDVGHGYVQERLRIQSHLELLKKYAPTILGMHLHDARGYSDHNELPQIKCYPKSD